MKITHKCIALLAIALCGLVTFTACGKKSSSSPGRPGSADEAGKTGNESIALFNDLLAFRKLAFEPLKKITDQTAKSEEFVTRVSSKPSWNMVLLGINPYEKIAKSKLAAPKSLSSADQEFLNSRIKLAKDGCAELNTIVSTLTAYYKAEDYKDDKHKKFLDTKPRIEALVGQIASACNEALQRADKISDEAERKILEKTPTGAHILAMRDIMAKCREQMAILTDERLLRVGSGTSYTDASKAGDAAKVKDLADAAEAMTAEINKLADKAKTLDPGVIKKAPAQARAYENFFKELEKEQGQVRKTIRYIREWGCVGNESDMRNLSQNLSGMTNEHNRFIK
ncbi:MAG: YiiG family protein [Puniceicoccales bacterium]|jgi:hypothetical protein|nr:YiiG family protein [Puniceicoccales bacterium]